MWGLSNETPFAADRAWVRDEEGAEVWIVAVKGTFTIQPDGTTTPARNQEPVLLAPEYRGEPGQSSLTREADLILTKQSTDVLLEGWAHAPHEQPVRALDVSMQIGPRRKVIRVYGDRWWHKGTFHHTLTEPEPFTRMPLTFENAFGGQSHQQEEREPERYALNPVGKGYTELKERVPGTAAPNLEHPDSLITAWDDRPLPACFGPIARDWQPRLPLAGTYDDTWAAERRPLLPLDFDPRFFQCAPADQQVPGFLKGGEEVRLTNVSPHGDLCFKLPRIFLGFETRFKKETQHHRPEIHTVVIEPHHNRVIITWHTRLDCHALTYDLIETTLYEKEKMPLVGAH
jgi:hypothetical protein